MIFKKLAKFDLKANFWSFGLIFQTPFRRCLNRVEWKPANFHKILVFFYFRKYFTFFIIFDLWVEFSDPSGGDLIDENEISSNLWFFQIWPQGPFLTFGPIFQTPSGGNSMRENTTMKKTCSYSSRLGHRLRGSEKSTQRSKMGLGAKFEKIINLLRFHSPRLSHRLRGSENSTQRSKMIKKVKYFIN